MKKILLYSLFVLAGLAILATVFFGIRQRIATAQIEREAQATPVSAPDLKQTTRLEILPLYENDRANEKLISGHGVSYLIRTDSATILMDLGHNPEDAAQLPSLQNMQSLGIGLKDIDAIVISHPHPDHVGGLKAWQDKTVSFGDFTGDLGNLTIFSPIPMMYTGAEIVYGAEPTLIGTDIGTTGVMPFLEVFPINLFHAKGYEQGLVIDVAGEGLVLITGCGHPTLENLVQRVEDLYGAPVVGVVGGLHYGMAGAEEMQPHIQFLSTRQLKLVALSPHDSGTEALGAFQSAFSDVYQWIRVGETIQFPDSHPID